MVCVPMSAAAFHGASQLAAPALRIASVRPVLPITGCHERWLLVE